MLHYFWFWSFNPHAIENGIILISLFAFLQGDEMKKTGIQPIPMMDRDKKDEVPQGQVWTLSVKSYMLYSINKTCMEKRFIYHHILNLMLGYVSCWIPCFVCKFFFFNCYFLLFYLRVENLFSKTLLKW